MVSDLKQTSDREYWERLSEDDLIKYSNEYWELGKKAHEERNPDEARKCRDISRILFRQSLILKIQKNSEIWHALEYYMKDIVR
jgi:hypothetical protein